MAGPTEFRPYSMAHYQALAKQITHEGNTDENRIDEVVKNALLSDPDELEKMLLCEGARCFSHQEDAPIHAALEALRQSWDEGVLELTSLRLKEAEQASASALRGNQIIRRGDILIIPSAAQLELGFASRLLSLVSPKIKYLQFCDRHVIELKRDGVLELLIAMSRDPEALLGKEKHLPELVGLAMELGCDSLLLSMFRVVQDHRFRFDRCFTEVHTKAQMHDLFHLVHLDSLDLKREEDGIPTSEVLKTGSSLLAGFAGRQDLDEKQRIKLESLQRGLRFAANLNKFCSPIGNAARNLADFKAAVLKELKEQGDTVLATGWSGNPGHFILMELHYREGQVSGSISNTGAGVSLHPLVLIEGHKIKRGNTLYLESVSEEEFSNSIFLHLLWNLQSYSEPVHSEKDFYHTFLASWPGEIRTADASVVYHSTQSGPTCTFRPLQQVAKDVLSPALGRLYKVYVQIATLLPRLSYIEGKDTIREIDQLIYATAQISRRVYRMATAGELSPAQERDLTTLCREVRKHLLRVRREYLAQIGYRSCSPKIEGIDLDPITVRSKVSNKSRDSELSEAIEIPAVNREQTIQAFQENVDAAQRLALYLHKQEAADFAIETLLNLPQEVLERPTDDQFEALLSLFKWELMQIENKAGAPRLSVRRGLASLLGFMACLNYCAAQDKGLPFARFHRFLLRDYLLSGNQLRRIKHPGDLAVYQRLLEELERLPCEGSQPDIKRADISYGFKLQWYGHSLQDLLNKHGELASLAALSGDPALDFLYGEQLENSWPKSIPKWHKEVSSQAYRLYSVCFSQLNNLTKPGRIGVSKSLSDGCGVWFAAGVGGWFHDSIEGCTSLSVLNDGTAVNFTAFNDIQNVRNSMEFNVHSASLAQTQTSKVVQGMTTQQAEEFLVIGSDPSLLLLRWTQFIQRYPVLLNNQIPCYHIEAVLFLPYQDEYPIDALRHALDFHRSLDAVIKLCQDANWKDAVLSLVRIQTLVLRRQLEQDNADSILTPIIERLQQVVHGLVTTGDGAHFMVGGLLRYCDHSSLSQIQLLAEACALQAIAKVPESLETPERWDDYNAAILACSSLSSPEGKLIPRDITLNADYCFPQNYLAVKQGKRFHFSYNGQAYYVARRNAGVEVARWLGDVWMLRVDRNELDIPAKHPLYAPGFPDALYWKGTDEIHVTAKDSFELLFRIRNGNVYRGDSDLRLVATDHVLGTYFESFAGKNPNDLLLWAARDGSLVKIEIPSLKFELEWQEGAWIWTENSRYSLDCNFALSDFDTLTHYLVLKDRSGSRIALVPNRAFDRAQNNLKELSSEDVRIFTYSIQPDGSVDVPAERAAALYLAYMALLRRDYRFGWRVASHMLKNAGGLNTALDDPTREEISKIIEGTSSDQHPHACAVRCALYLCLQSETIRRPTADEEGLMSKIKTDIRTYSLQQNKCQEFPLSVLSLSRATFPGQSFNIWSGASNAPSLPKLYFDYSFMYLESPAVPAGRSSWFRKAQPASPHYDWSGNATPPIRFINPDPMELLANFPSYYRMAWEKTADFTPVLDLIIQGLRFNPDPTLRSVMTVLHLTCEGKIKTNPAEMQKWSREGTLGVELKKVITCFLRDHPETSPSIQEKLGVAQPKITTGTRDPLLRPLGLVPAVFSSEPISVAPDLSVRLQDESFIRLISLPEIETQRTELSSQCTEIAATVYGVSRSEPCETRELQHMADALGQYARQWQPRTPMLPCIQDEAAAVRALDLLQLEMVYHVEAAHAASQEIQDLLKLVPTRELGSIEAGLRHEWDLRRIVLQIAQGTMPETPEGLVDAVFRFLIHETEAQMGARAMLKLASLIDRGPIVGFDHTECKDLAQDFANELKPRAYELRSDLETLHCLCFEWLSDKRLFVDQYEKLKALDSDTVLEFQAPTGSGKSSTIFPLFLWLVITRNTRGLTVMTVRDSQLEDQLKLLRALLGDAFGTAIQPFVVDRDMLSSRDGVERSLQLVADARAGKRIILTTPRTVHACLFLAPVAAIGGRELFDLLVKLRTELTDNAIHFVDESKEVFDVSRSYTYSLGAPEPIDREAQSGVFSVYSQLALQTELHRQWNFDFLAGYTSGQGQGIIPENYALFRESLIEQAPKDLHAWLSGDPGLPEGMSDHLYFTNLRYLLHQSFSVLLTTKYKVGYRRKADLTAEPLEDGKAHRGMEFANPIQALAFTVQANLAEPYTSAEIRPYIDAVQEQLRVGNFQHPVAMLWRNRIAPELPGLPPLSDLKDLSLVCDLLNDPSRLELRLAFIHMYVLPRVTFTKAKLDSNPHIHIQALKHAIAASGTTRPETLPPQVRSIRDLAGVINTLMQLWNCSQDKVREIKGAHAREKLRSVLAEPKHRVLVDAAGEFLKLDVPVIAAEVFASRPEAHALVYYNDEGQLMALLRHERVSIPLHACTLEEQHFYYMLHRRYAIGADLPLPIDIQGYVTVDRLCDTTLLAQAAARLRYLGRGQVAHIGVPTEDRNTILANLGGMDSTLRLADILRWAAIVEGQDKGKQFYQAIGAFLGAHESEVFWGRVNSETSDETLLRFRELLTRNVPSSVRSSAHVNLHAQLAADVVESLLNDRVARWEGLRGAIPELGNKAFIEAFRRYVDLSKLPAQLAVGQAEPGHAVTLQQEEVAQEHGHTHQVGVEDAQRGSMQFDKVPQRPRTGCHRDWINSSSSIHLGDLAIHFSPNALGVAVPTDPRTQVEAVCLEFVVKRKRSDGSLSLLALGVEDSAYVIQQMETFKATPAEDFDYYLLNDTGCMGADAAMPYDSIKKALEGDIKLTLAMKLLSGNHLITDREEELWMHLRSDSQALLNHVQKLVPLRPELNRLLGL